jgi:hypothetical protein
MLRRLKAARAARGATPLTRETIGLLQDRIGKIVAERGRCVIAVAGSPGSGKSRCASRIGERGVFSYPPRSVTVIDDLKTPEGTRVSRGGLYKALHAEGRILGFLFDYKAALYLRRADLCILLMVTEGARLDNLRKRSPRSRKRYGKARYRFTPLPLFAPHPGSLFVCTEDLATLLEGTA